jgi:hypothetical protein
MAPQRFLGQAERLPARAIAVFSLHHARIIPYTLDWARVTDRDAVLDRLGKGRSSRSIYGDALELGEAPSGALAS